MTLEAGRQTARPKLVLMRLADYSDSDGGSVFPKVATIAKECGLTVRQVQRILRSFEEQGLIRIEHEATRYTPRVYRLTLRGDINQNQGVTLATDPRDASINDPSGGSVKEQKSTAPSAGRLIGHKADAPVKVLVALAHAVLEDLDAAGTTEASHHWWTEATKTMEERCIGANLTYGAPHEDRIGRAVKMASAARARARGLAIAPRASRDRQEAEHMLRAWGRCKHDPICDDWKLCLKRIKRVLIEQKRA